jgi:hypothetical protein
MACCGRDSLRKSYRSLMVEKNSFMVSSSLSWPPPPPRAERRPPTSSGRGTEGPTFSTAFHSQNRTSCDEQPLLRNPESADWLRALKTANSASGDFLVAVTPYSGIFYV